MTGISCLHGILIGIIFGVPVGAVGAMTVQRTISYGRAAGFVTGLGSSAADCVYAAISAFGLTFISDILLKYRLPVNLSGGAFILFLGLRMLFGKKAEVGADRIECGAAGYGKMFLSSFVVGITNPAAILSFLFAFSWFEVGTAGGMLSSALLVLGVFIGTYLWWTALTLTVHRLSVRKKADAHLRQRLDAIFGIALIIFAGIIFSRLIIEF